MKRFRNFYRTTVGIVVTMSLYVPMAAATTSMWPVATASPNAIGVLFALFTIVFGGAGIFLLSDAMTRVLDALMTRYSGFITEVMGA